MTNQKRREAFEKAARDLGCDESDDARDHAAGKVLKPAKPKVGEAYWAAFTIAQMTRIDAAYSTAFPG